jgi:glycosyltransferase involved in cell wall biosynthesis
MLDNPMISVIMPVYNAKDYVEDAIKSVLNQSYRDFELIIVDDGANDGSERICDQYAKKDRRICGARNTGLANAKGKYIAFCDHDDIYFPDYLMKSVTKAEELNVPLVKFGYRSEYWRDGNLVKMFEEKVPNTCVSASELSLNYQLLNLTVRALWNGLYLKSFIIDNNIFFDEEFRAGMEDFLFNIRLLKHICTIAYIPNVLFLHFGRFGQSTSLEYSDKRLGDIMVVQNEEAMWLLSQKASPKVIVQHRRTYLALFRETLIHHNCPLSVKEKKRLLKELNSSYTGFHKDTLLASLSEIPKNPKIGIKDTLYSLRMYSILLLVWRLHSMFGKE